MLFGVSTGLRGAIRPTLLVAPLHRPLLRHQLRSISSEPLSQMKTLENLRFDNSFIEELPADKETSPGIRQVRGKVDI